MATPGTQIAPEQIRAICELLDQGFSRRHIAKTVGCAKSTVDYYAGEYERDPDAVRLLWGGLDDPEHEYLSEVRRLILKDRAWLHEQLGFKVAGFLREGWSLQELHRECGLFVFRGAGKSTAFTETSAIQEVARSIEAWRLRQTSQHVPDRWIPNISVAICSAQDGIAIGHADNVQQFFERLEVRRIWGPCQGPRWKSGDWIVRQRDQALFDPTCFAKGITSKDWTGHHPSLLIFDDLEVDENTDSATKIYKLNSRLALKIDGIVLPDTRVWYVGTPYAKLGPINQRIEAWLGKGDPEDRIPSIVTPAIHVTEKGAEVSTWPERFPLDDKPGVQGLRTKRRKMERKRKGAFAANYLLDCSQLVDRNLRPEQVRWTSISTIKRPSKVFMAIDMAWAVKPGPGTDHTAVATGFLDGANVHLLRVMRCKKDPTTTRAMIEEEYLEGRRSGRWPDPEVIWCERTGLYSDAFASIRKDLSHLPWVPYKPKGDKAVRAVPLVHLLSAGRFWAVSGTGDWWGELKAEMSAFPAGAFDDQVDAVVTLATRMTRGVGLGAGITLGGKGRVGGRR